MKGKRFSRLALVLSLAIVFSVLVYGCGNNKDVSGDVSSSVNEPTVNQTQDIAGKIDGNSVKNSDGDYRVLGFFDSVRKVEGDRYKVNGWAYSDTKKIENIVIANSKGEIKGTANIGIKRPGLPEAIKKPNATNAGWSGDINDQDANDVLFAYVKIEGESNYVRISNGRNTQNASVTNVEAVEDTVSAAETKVDPANVKTAKDGYLVQGFIDAAQKTGDNTFKVSGWAYSDDKEIEYILITNTEGTVIGAARYGFYRPRLAEAIKKPNANNAGWAGTAKTQGSEEELVAYAKIKDESSYVQLKNKFKIK